MKNHIASLIGIFLFAASPQAFAQKEPPKFEESQITYTPDGSFETLFDNEGHAYDISELVVKTPDDGEGQVKSVLLCSSGYFNLYFETGSGMEDLNNPTHNQRRDVLCQVFSDISSFINSPLTSTGQKVNIHIRNIQIAFPNAATSSVGASASPYYCLPASNPNNYGGIADNQIWKTILSGTDAYTNVYYPILNQGTSFYHGKVSVNFYNSSILWHTDMTTSPAPPGYMDLYTVLLHEVTHALGFTSLIDNDGTSVFPTGFNYYSRYDRFLKNHAGTQSLITNSGSCSLYDYQFNPALTTATFVPGGCTQSGSSDYTNCATSAIYQGTNTVPLYTPNCYEAGSTLSHFEDMCYPTSGAPYGDDLYFVLSNQGGTGTAGTKRHLQPEERNVLCDLGYSVNGTFGNAVNHNNHNYNTGTCPGISVVGFNDGISGNTYAFSGSSGAIIPISGILTNDFGATTFECLSDLNDPAAIFSATTGSSTTVVDFSSSVLGIHLLRYIPVSSTGQRGNVTYVYVSVSNPNCASVPCNMLNNGDFESYTTCSSSQGALPAGCWRSYHGSGYIFDRYCVPNGSTFAVMYLPTPHSIPAADSYNGSPNDNFATLIGMGSNTYGQSIQNYLSSPLVAGNSYTISFWARVANDWFMTGTPSYLPHYSSITFAGSQTTLTNVSGMIPNLPAGSEHFGDIAIINDNQWRQYTITFVYAPGNPSAPNLQNLIMLHSTFLISSVGQDFIYIDDVQLMPTDVTLDVPQTLCANQTISNLGNYLSNFPSGGTFSGNGVSFSGGNYIFDPTVAGVGTHTISFTYINSMGCEITLSDNITVVNTNISVSASASPASVCAGAPVTLSASGATTYTWQPGNLSGATVNVNPPGNTQYTVTGESNGCVATATVDVTATPIPVTLSSSLNNICPGQQVTLTPSGASTYVLTYNGTTQSGTGPFVVTQTNTTVYDLVGTASNGCTGSTQLTVNTIACETCSSCTNTLGLNGFISTSPPVNTEYCINNNVTINANVTFSRNMLKIAPNVQMTVASGATLTIIGSHLYACDEMWKGIVVESGGHVVIQPYINQSGLPFKTTLIEDAMVAIDFLPVTAQQSTILLSVSNATFNRNYTSIQIQGYPYTNVNSMFSIQNSLFTSRTIFNESTPTTWPLTSTVKANNGTTNPLTPPYIVSSTYPVAYLKAPYMYQIPPFGLSLKNVGFSTLTTPPTYSTLTIGAASQATDDCNLYDNILTIADITNSNVKLANSTFQHFTLTGTSVNALSNNGNRHILTVGGTTSESCKFFDAGWAIYVNGYNDVAIINNTIRSQQVYSSSNLTTPHKGKYGIYLNLTKFSVMNIYTNTIYNVEKPIYVGVNSANAHTNVSNSININNNIIRRNHPNLAASTSYSADGIIVEQSSLLGVGTTVEIVYNTIDGVFRGITLNNWERALLKSNYNEMILVQRNTAHTHYGIRFSNIIGGSGNEILGNKVTGFGYSVANSSGIEFSNSKLQSVQCNGVTNTYRGFLFNATCSNTTTRRNTMENHHYGFMLDNAGVIGLQGSSTTPADNRWLGSTWSLTGTAGGNFKTYTNNSSNPNPGSLMYVRNVAAYNPNDSYGNGTASTPYSNSISPQTLIYVSNPPFAQLCPFIQEPTPPAEITISNPELGFEEEKSMMSASISEHPLLEALKEKAMNSRLDEEDRIALVELATSCPYTVGKSVYEAGAYYNLWFKTAEVFSYDCSSSNGADENALDENELLVYPNPNEGTFSISIQTPSGEQVKVRIKDMNGREVYLQQYTLDREQISVEAALASGAYLVEMESLLTGELSIGRIVVQR